MAEMTYQNKLNADGTQNSKYVDLLEEDKAISGQKYVCVSFVSPENILKKRELFMFEEFLKDYDFSKKYYILIFLGSLLYPLGFCFNKKYINMIAINHCILQLYADFIAINIYKNLYYEKNTIFKY